MTNEKFEAVEAKLNNEEVLTADEIAGLKEVYGGAIADVTDHWQKMMVAVCIKRELQFKLMYAVSYREAKGDSNKNVRKSLNKLYKEFNNLPDFLMVGNGYIKHYLTPLKSIRKELGEVAKKLGLKTKKGLLVKVEKDTEKELKSTKGKDLVELAKVLNNAPKKAA